MIDGRSGTADPAFEAHLAPIAMWAKAVWRDWIGIGVLDFMVCTASAKLAKAVNKWSRVTGPLTATIAVLLDLGWQPIKPDAWVSPDKSVWQCTEQARIDEIEPSLKPRAHRMFLSVRLSHGRNREFVPPAKW